MDFELIFFAGVTVFIVYKLWTVLGKANYEDIAQAKAQAATKEVKKPVQTKEDAKKAIMSLVEEAQAEEEEIPKNLQKEFAEAKQLDPTLTLAKFVEGAEAAFEMVLEAFAKNKQDTLKFLLSNDIYKDFEKELKKREKSEKEASTTLVSMEETEVLDVEVDGNICQIMVKFVSEQINFVKNKAGKIIEGSKSQIDHVTDIWTFERNLKSKKPNWTVVSTDTA